MITSEGKFHNDLWFSLYSFKICFVLSFRRWFKTEHNKCTIQRNDEHYAKIQSLHLLRSSHCNFYHVESISSENRDFLCLIPPTNRPSNFDSQVAQLILITRVPLKDFTNYNTFCNFFRSFDYITIFANHIFILLHHVVDTKKEKFHEYKSMNTLKFFNVVIYCSYSVKPIGDALFAVFHHKEISSSQSGSLIVWA